MDDNMIYADDNDEHLQKLLLESFLDNRNINSDNEIIIDDNKRNEINNDNDKDKNNNNDSNDDDDDDDDDDDNDDDDDGDDDDDILFLKASKIFKEASLGMNTLMENMNDNNFSKFRCNVCSSSSSKVYRTQHLLVAHFVTQHKDILSKVVIDKYVKSIKNDYDYEFNGHDETKKAINESNDEKLALEIAIRDYIDYSNNNNNYNNNKMNDNCQKIISHSNVSNIHNNHNQLEYDGNTSNGKNIKRNNNSNNRKSNKKGKSQLNLSKLYSSDVEDTDDDDDDDDDNDHHNNNQNSQGVMNSDINENRNKEERLNKFLSKMDRIVENLNRMIIEGKRNYESSISTSINININSSDANADDADLDIDTNINSQQQSSLLTSGILRNYQVGGMEWLLGLAFSGFNGILADEMGLGKTVQVLAFLCKLFEKDKNLWGPHLIICPLSVISTWVNDINKFCSDEIDLFVHQGEKSERYMQFEAWKKSSMKTASKKICIVLTTYNLVMNDITLLEKNKNGLFQWKYLIVDEGHRLKNKASILYNVLGSLDTKKRLLLTGTPVQNNLEELWNLFSFILPDMFNHLSHYNEWFNKPFNNDIDDDRDDSDEDYLVGKKRKTGNPNDKSFKINNTFNEDEKKIIISSLHRVIKPFILRRKKEDVAVDIPPKIEKLIYCKMSGLQQKLFYILKEVVHRNANGSGSSLETMTGPTNKFSMLSLSYNNMLMQLRKLCLHPFLILEDLHSIPDSLYYHYLLKCSGKLCMLNRLLKILLGLGHKILIFSQMTTMIDILEGYLYNLGIGYQRLDGKVSTENRLKSLHEFNDPNNNSTPVFLLSTRAGGVGINLQAADTVILFDSDWNPQQDLQAMSRAHRIGQTRSVLVLRLVSLGVSKKYPSIEERMLRTADKKLYAANTVLEDGKFDMGTIEPDAKSAKNPINFFLEDTDHTTNNSQSSNSSSRDTKKNKKPDEEDGNVELTDDFLINLCRRGHNDNYDSDDDKVTLDIIRASLKSCEKSMDMSSDLDIDWAEWLGTGRASGIDNNSFCNDNNVSEGIRRLRKRNNDLNFNESFLANDTPTRKNNKSNNNNNNNNRNNSKTKTEKKSRHLEINHDTSSDIADECVLCGSAWLDYDEENDLMVICDGCNGPFHLVCIGYTEIPSGNWFCQFCNFDKT